MTSVLDLVRPDLRAFAGYASARRQNASGHVWLNANENPWAPSVDESGVLNRYPEPQPHALRERLASLYGVRANQLMVSRGSDEAIDLIVRAFCRAGIDGVLIAPPTFGMYAVSARVQNAPLVELPLVDEDDRFSLDVTAFCDILASGAVRVAFVCSPANPTGQALSLRDIERIAHAAEGSAVLVVDEAYAEFSSVGAATSLLTRFSHLILLRTLSKAYALAGARIGTAIADPEVITVLRALQAPYPVPSPSAAIALQALSDERHTEAKERVATLIRERARLSRELARQKRVTAVYASESNFVLARFDDPEAAFQSLLTAGVVVRDVRAMPQLEDALRISIGTPEENTAVMEALK
jgi:histidinol-phosphate aminotransferase